MPLYYLILQASLTLVSYVDESPLWMVPFGFISMIQLLRKSEPENCTSGKSQCTLVQKYIWAKATAYGKIKINK